MGRKDEEHHQDTRTTRWAKVPARYGVEIGRELFRQAARGMPRETIERAIERQARPVIAWVLHKEIRRLQNIDSFMALSESAQQCLVNDLEQNLKRTYYEHLEAFARDRAREQDAIAFRLANIKRKGRFIHERTLATANAAAYRGIMKVAASRSRSATPHDRARS